MRPGRARHGSVRRCTSYQSSNCCASTPPAVFAFCFFRRCAGILPPWRNPPTDKQPAEKQPEAPPPRRNRASEVGGDVTLAARTAFARAGFADPTLLLRWEEIAGAEVARIARPIKLNEGPSGGVLTLKAEPGAAVFLQHESRALCGRINAYLGRVAVARLRFVQGPLLAPHPAPPLRPQPVDPPPADPARRWQGPPTLGHALLDLARQRTRTRTS